MFLRSSAGSGIVRATGGCRGPPKTEENVDRDIENGVRLCASAVRCAIEGFRASPPKGVARRLQCNRGHHCLVLHTERFGNPQDVSHRGVL